MWQQRRRVAKDVVVSASVCLDQWRRAQDASSMPSLGPWVLGDGAELWTKPVEGRFKINVDAALFQQDGFFGSGGVVRDSQGLLVAAHCWRREGVVQPDIAEAVGLKEVLGWIKNSGWLWADVEMDSLVVVHAVRSSIVMKSVFGLLIEDCKRLLAELPNVCLHFVKRSANRVAHLLARISRIYADRVFLGCDVYPLMLRMLF